MSKIIVNYIICAFIVIVNGCLYFKNVHNEAKDISKCNKWESLEYITEEYRAMYYDKLNETDTLFFLALFNDDEERKFLMFSGNDKEIPRVVFAPPLCDESCEETIKDLSIDSLMYKNSCTKSTGMIDTKQKWVEKNKRLFCGYVQIRNNFIFIYNCVDSVDIMNITKGMRIEKDLDSNANLKRYNTDEWNLDPHIWVFSFNENNHLCLEDVTM
ncbi:MAG: hypothetical protein MJZ41_02075 [Bacteroidaceae bacterium]|nr:hypothetical protein [Bacteroidaceae bacterium]